MAAPRPPRPVGTKSSPRGNLNTPQGRRELSRNAFGRSHLPALFVSRKLAGDSVQMHLGRWLEAPGLSQWRGGVGSESSPIAREEAPPQAQVFASEFLLVLNILRPPPPPLRLGTKSFRAEAQLCLGERRRQRMASAASGLSRVPLTPPPEKIK